VISLKQFKYFVEIVEAGSYSRAAEKLYVAQSALSRQIKELEDELQTQLLTRDARQFELTPAGQLFFERAKRILEDIDDTVVQARQVGQGAQGVIRLQHSSSVILTPQLTSALSQLLDEFPGVTLDVSMLPSENQTLEIEEGRADIGLLRLPTLRRHPHIHVREISTERLMVAVSQHSPLAALDNIELAALSEQAFISIPHKVEPDRGQSRHRHRAGMYAPDGAGRRALRHAGAKPVDDQRRTGLPPRSRPTGGGVRRCAGAQTRLVFFLQHGDLAVRLQEDALSAFQLDVHFAQRLLDVALGDAVFLHHVDI
jgi:DNA-binding transcriptional LysR family regulator